MLKVLLHPDVIRSFKPRPGIDIKKLKGRDKTLYRLRVGDYRFEYFVEKDTVYVIDAFRRERDYR